MKKVWLSPILFALLTAGCIRSSAPSSSALTVTVTMDSALAGSNKVAVSWTILIKLSPDYFDVEKSQDGISWHSIAVVKPDSIAGVPFTYTAFDLFPVRGANFYRIRVKDLSGRTTFTPVKTVRVAAFCNMAVYPNPSSGQVNISLGQVPVNDWYISLITLTGQIILQKKYSRSNIAVCLPVNNIPAGNYILEITDGSSKQRKRLLINHS